jgi:hypothetical protein
MMKKTNTKQDQTGHTSEMENELDIEGRLPLAPLPRLMTVSGLYKGTSRIILRHPLPIPRPIPIPIPIPRQPSIPGTHLTQDFDDSLMNSDLDMDDGSMVENGMEMDFGDETREAGTLDWRLPWKETEELRLDVDDRYPQNTVSGTIRRGFIGRVHWIAKLTRTSRNVWSGNIWHKDGTTSMLPQTSVVVTATRSWFPNQRRAKVEFRGPGQPTRIRYFNYVSRYFRKVEFEYDHVTGVTPVTTINTGDHPNHPASLPAQNLSIANVYRRSGFNVSISGDKTNIPLTGVGTSWSDAEMHDAMQTYWSRFANTSQWALWTLFANKHDRGSGLGGIMFDDIGPNHRQGTSLFYDSFISNAPSGDADPAAWVKRMRFWTAVHEMGHAFNLAHSWQKQHPTSWGTPWIPLANEPEARSFMNYPYNVSGGQTAFFSDFQFRFSNNELLFMRHAPERFVKMGGANWFDNHGFEGANIQENPTFRLETRVNRKTPAYEFLEPVNIELKLTNLSDRPQLVEKDILDCNEHLTIVTKRENDPAKQMTPFAHYCSESKLVALQPGQSLYGTLMVSVGRGGWNIDDAGRYVIQICLHHDERDIVSEPMHLVVRPASNFDEQVLAQDFFNEDVGRILTFGGSRVLESGLNTLKTISSQLKGQRVAQHANLVLGQTMARDFKTLELKDGVNETMASASSLDGAIKVSKAKVGDGLKTLTSALDNKADGAIDTFGHINFKNLTDQFTDMVNNHGDITQAVKVQESMLKTMTKRKVVEPVLQDIKSRISSYSQKTKKATN